MFPSLFGASAPGQIVLPGGVGGPSALLDDFNRADEGPPPSANWLRSRLAVIDGGGMAVVSLTAQGTAGSKQNDCFWTQLFGPDMEAYFTVVDKAAGAVRIPYVGLRIQNPTLDAIRGYYATFLNDGEWQCYRYDSSSSATMLGNGALTMNNGDSFKGSIVGDLITLYRKPAGGAWGSVGMVTDATYSGNGYISLGTYETAAPAIALDDFGGGTV